ncbi:MAG: hypothetical protein NT012_00015 [Candidatus Nealsonbacteria bacterium]|nr:hypothetical protein [Candidatus Nealsonbacteria bacterium]
MEFEQERSYFYGFDLIKVIHPKEVNIGIVENKIVGYKNLVLPSLIKDNKGKNWTKKLSSLNDKNFFGGGKNDILKVKFDNIQDLKSCYLVFQASLRANYERVDKASKKIEKVASRSNELVRVLKQLAVPLAIAKGITELSEAKALKSIIIKATIDGEKGKCLNIIHPREKFCFSIINISNYLKKNQNTLTLDLEWTGSHNLSFIGLTEPDTRLKLEKIKLAYLEHSSNKNIKKEQLEKGEVQLIPGQFINLEFPYKKDNLKSSERVSFILKSKGYYTKF